MREYKLTINHRLAGIKESSVGLKSDFQSDDGDSGENSGSMSLADSIRLRQLNGRIKILEIELQKAREESFKAGYDEGKSSTIQEANKRIESMRIEMQSMELKYLETVEQLELPLLELSKRIAGQILTVDLKIRDDHDAVLKERLRKMLYEVVDQNKAIIEVHPDHLESINNQDMRTELNLPHKMQTSFIAGQGIGKGEARIKTEDYFIDGTFEGQLEQVHDQLKDKEK